MIDLRQIYHETIADCFEGEFHEPGKSELYKKEVKLESQQVTGFDTKLSVVNDDCLVVCNQMQDEGLNPAVLNMASAYRPGGGVLNEEEFRGRYKDIRFAIIEDHNSRGRNYQTFKNIIDKNV